MRNCVSKYVRLCNQSDSHVYPRSCSASGDNQARERSVLWQCVPMQHACVWSHLQMVPMCCCWLGGTPAGGGTFCWCNVGESELAVQLRIVACPQCLHGGGIGSGEEHSTRPSCQVAPLPRGAKVRPRACAIEVFLSVRDRLHQSMHSWELHLTVASKAALNRKVSASAKLGLPAFLPAGAAAALRRICAGLVPGTTEERGPACAFAAVIAVDGTSKVLRTNTSVHWFEQTAHNLSGCEDVYCGMLACAVVSRVIRSAQPRCARGGCT